MENNLSYFQSVWCRFSLYENDDFFFQSIGYFLRLIANSLYNVNPIQKDYLFLSRPPPPPPRFIEMCLCIGNLNIADDQLFQKSRLESFTGRVVADPNPKILFEVTRKPIRIQEKIFHRLTVQSEPDKIFVDPYPNPKLLF